MNNIFYHSGSFGDIIYSIPFCLSNIGIFSFDEIKNCKTSYTLLLDLTCCHKPNGDYDFALENLNKIG
jgi:hypothetical protein